MPRPRSFDRDDVLDRALGTFAELGYEAASLQTLVEATGLSRSSLYAEFENKHGLYLAALDRYRARGAATLEALFEAAPTALAGLEAYLRSVADDAAAGDGPPRPGCLMTNAAAEVASRDAETAARARAALDAMLAAVERQVERAQADGDLPPGDARARAGALVATVYGLRALGKAGVTRAEADGIADRALAQLRR